jgi:hypothetical protein
MNQHLALNQTFFRPVIRSAFVVILGFLIAPTQLLYSFYEAHGAFKAIAIIVGVLVVMRGLFNMLKISLNAINTHS